MPSYEATDEADTEADECDVGHKADDADVVDESDEADVVDVAAPHCVRYVVR